MTLISFEMQLQWLFSRFWLGQPQKVFFQCILENKLLLLFITDFFSDMLYYTIKHVIVAKISKPVTKTENHFWIVELLVIPTFIHIFYCMFKSFRQTIKLFHNYFTSNNEWNWMASLEQSIWCLYHNALSHLLLLYFYLELLCFVVSSIYSSKEKFYVFLLLFPL